MARSIVILLYQGAPRRPEKDWHRQAIGRKLPSGQSRSAPPARKSGPSSDACGSCSWTRRRRSGIRTASTPRSEEHTSELQSLRHLVCRLLLEKKKKITI